MVLSRSFAHIPDARFPRASGDGPERLLVGNEDLPFPPRERGWSLLAVVHGATPKVSPARAGMVP